LPGGEETSPLEQNPTPGQVIAFYKYKTTKLINELTGFPGIKIWQCNYYGPFVMKKLRGEETSPLRTNHL
jgi:hypothetical protein